MKDCRYMRGFRYMIGWVGIEGCMSCIGICAGVVCICAGVVRYMRGL